MVITHMYRSKLSVLFQPYLLQVIISISDSFVYTYYRSCIYDISILWPSVVYTIGSPLKKQSIMPDSAYGGL